MIVHLTHERKPGRSRAGGDAAWLTCFRSTRPALGDRSYLVHDGDVGVVIDPQRDIDRVLRLAAERGVRITHVLETHIHNDYVTGGLALARETGAALPRQRRRPGRLRPDPGARRRRCRVHVLGPGVAGPGHAGAHVHPPVAYVLADGSGGSGRGVHRRLAAVTARPGAPTCSARRTRPSWPGPSTVGARLATELPDRPRCSPPTGSAASAPPPRPPVQLVDDRPREARNPALTLARTQLRRGAAGRPGRLPGVLRAHGPGNATGPGRARPVPAAPGRPGRTAPPDRGRGVGGGPALAVAFAAGHLPGSLSFELDGSFATYLGWLLPWGTPVTLLGETPGQVAAAQRELVRIGIDRPAAAATGPPADWADGGPLDSLPAGRFAELAAARQASGPAAAGRAGCAPARWNGRRRTSRARCTSRCTSCPARSGRDARRRGVGALPRRVPGAGRRVPARRAGRPVISVDDDFGHARTAGLPLVQA